MKLGVQVQLRSPEEILRTLDGNGALDGVPFMPEMLQFFGRTMQVTATTERLCDTITPVAVRKIPDAALLQDHRCDGAAHGGCQAECRLYWKDAWLTPVTLNSQARPVGPGAAFDELEQLVRANVISNDSTSPEPVYRCQATELQQSGGVVGAWDSHSLLRQLTTRSVSPTRFVRVMGRAALVSLAARARGIKRFPFMMQNPPSDRNQVAEPQGLDVGTLVRVRSKEEIARTLTPDGKNRGLWFDREMLRYCGTTARVRAKVERFVDESTGRMVRLHSDCYVLEGVVCSSDVSDGRWFCSRAIYTWWREAWLEPIPEN
jgi:hypothetical protein